MILVVAISLLRIRLCVNQMADRRQVSGMQTGRRMAYTGIYYIYSKETPLEICLKL